MSLLSRYKGHRSSLSLFSPSEVENNYVHRVISSYRSQLLEPMDSPSETETEPASVKTVSTDSLPDAGDDIPNQVYPQEINHVDLIIQRPEVLPEFGSNSFEKIFSDHIEVCKLMCDFSAATYDLDAKQIKTDSLNGICSLLEPEHAFKRLGDQLLSMLFDVIELHVFRKFNPLPDKYLFSDDLVALVEPSIPHLNLIYKALAVFAKYDNRVDFNFIKKLVERFALPDPDERNLLSKIVIDWTKKYSMGEELKIVLCNIISDYLSKVRSPHTILPVFTVLKEFINVNTDKKIFHEYLIPMLGAYHIIYFGKELFALIQAFATGDQTLVVPAINGCLRHWPKTRSAKLVLFLSETASLMTKMKPKEFKELRVIIFKLYGAAACSPNYKVAEAAFCIWTKLPLEPYIMDSARHLFPLIYYPVSQAIRTHWSSDVINIMNLTLEAMNKIDSFLFQDLCRSKITIEEKDLVRQWAMISRQAMINDRQLNLASKLAEIQKTFARTTQPQIPKPALNNISTTGRKIIKPSVSPLRSGKIIQQY